MAASSAANAEVGGAISALSDLRFRGYSLSGGHPVAIADFSYDDRSGLYAAVSGSAVASSNDGIKPLGLQLNAGYAKQLSGVTVDAGVIHSTYSRYSSPGYSNSYTELYAGLTYKHLSSRVYFSPRYFQSKTSTVYAEIEGDLQPAPKLRLTGHLGMLAPVSSRAGTSEAYRKTFDWRLGLARELGPLSLQVALTGVERRRDASDHRHGGNALILGASWPL
jgi:uncharacterized protein (TIGR02001 family)